MRIAGLVLMVVAVAAISQEKPKPTLQDLLRADEDFGKASAQRGLDGWLSFFDEDAVIFPAGKEIVKGLEAVRLHYKAEGFTPEGLTWKPAGAELAASGDLGYTYGTWTYASKDASGKATLRTGKYLTTWKRQKDGGWKVLADIGAPDPPKG